jgi:hypothetical protein
MRTAIFYYGCELPARRDAAAALRDAAVVLQPYHPLLATGQFADYFPHCSLYVYWNPTGVPAADLAGADPGIALLAPDPVWNLARLDLRSAAARQFAARRGLLALRAGGPAATGLFVDDLDLWSQAGPDQDAALAVVQAVLTAAGREVGLFVNRGFACWPRLAGLSAPAGPARLDAVLLEELTPALADRLGAGDQQWIREQVVPAARAARSGGAACFGLTYEPGPEAPPAGDAARELAALTDGVLRGCRSLDQWPEDFR